MIVNSKLTNNKSVALVEGLKPYKEYEFRVLLFRPGTVHLGSSSTDQYGPAAILRTNCGSFDLYFYTKCSYELNYK